MIDLLSLGEILGCDLAGFGFSLAGGADVEALRDGFLLPESVRLGYPRALSFGMRLSDGVLEEIAGAPTPLYFHHYRQVNAALDRGALLISAALQARGFRALPVAASQIVDWAGQRAHLSHKHIARQAGLGWIGRSNLLIHPKHGARLRLVTILTDLPFSAGSAPAFGCGACRACLAVCPAAAIHERPEDFDHLACYEKLKEFRNRGLVGQFICGVCVKACRGTAPAGDRP